MRGPPNISGDAYQALQTSVWEICISHSGQSAYAVGLLQDEAGGVFPGFSKGELGKGAAPCSCAGRSDSSFLNNVACEKG